MPELADFRGVWSLDRRIEDRRGAQSGRLRGRASFVPGDAGLVYEEEGLFDLDAGPTLAARQRHLWQPSPPEIVVRFADGRSFHRFDASHRRPEGRHACGADLYLVRYDFADWPRWRVVWSVSGPAKAYRTISTYARAWAAG